MRFTVHFSHRQLLIPTGPRGVRAGMWHVGMAITNCFPTERGSYEMNVYEPCLFSKFAVHEEPAVDGGSIAPGEFVLCKILRRKIHSW